MAFSVFNEGLAIVAFLFGVCFFTFGAMKLGKGKPDGAGSVFFFCGAVNAIVLAILEAWSVHLYSKGLITMHDLIVRTTVVIFNYIYVFVWTSAGIICAKGQDTMPHCNAALMVGLIMVPYVIQFARWGMYYPAVMAASFAWANWSTVLEAYGKLGPKPVGWTFIIESFYALWVPAAIFILGLPFP